MKNGTKLQEHLVAFVFTLLAVCLSCGSKAASPGGKGGEEKGGKVVAKVNGEPIYEETLGPYVKQELKKFRKFGLKKDTTKLERRLRQKALQKVVAQVALNQESQKEKIEGIEARVQERMNSIKAKHGTEQGFAAMLKAKKLTEKQLTENIRAEIHVDEYLKRKGIRDPNIPEAEIIDYYENNQGNFMREEYVDASHILIKADAESSPEERRKARKKAERIRQEILSGQDFGEMAKEHSEDGRALNSGKLGYIKKGFMPPEFDKVAFSMSVGEVSEPVQTQHGFHIIKVSAKKPAGVARYEEVKDFIARFLQGQLTKQMLAAHIKELKAKAKTEVLLPELR